MSSLTHPATNTALASIVPSAEAAPPSTLSNGVVVPANTGLVTNTNGEVVPATQVSATGSVTAAPVLGSQTLSNGAVVPIAAAPASTTLPNGSVVPISNAASPASTTLPNGSVVPVSNANAASTTLPNGLVVPVASVPSVTDWSTRDPGTWCNQCPQYTAAAKRGPSRANLPNQCAGTFHPAAYWIW